MEYKMTKENVKWLGRVTMLKESLWCGHSGSGVAFTVTGTKATITLLGDDTVKGMQTDSLARVGIYINGIRMIDLSMCRTEQKIDLFVSLEPRTVEVMILKLSENAMSSFGIRGLEVENFAGLYPVPDKKRKIEVIGDSITCGFGVDAEDAGFPFRTDTEDVTRTYAYHLAKALDADLSICAFSGYGIISGYTETGVPSKTQLVPDFYEKAGFSYGKPYGEIEFSKIEWDFTQFIPSLVLVNLGTNDDSYCRENETLRQEFSKAYAAFLKKVREKNRDAFLLCTVGTMSERIIQPVMNAVEQYQKETKDEKVHFFPLPAQQPEDGLATYFHPTERTHKKVAVLLKEEIKKLMVFE